MWYNIIVVNLFNHFFNLPRILPLSAPKLGGAFLYPIRGELRCSGHLLRILTKLNICYRTEKFCALLKSEQPRLDTPKITCYPLKNTFFPDYVCYIDFDSPQTRIKP